MIEKSLKNVKIARKLETSPTGNPATEILSGWEVVGRSGLYYKGVFRFSFSVFRVLMHREVLITDCLVFPGNRLEFYGPSSAYSPPSFRSSVTPHRHPHNPWSDFPITELHDTVALILAIAGTSSVNNRPW